MYLYIYMCIYIYIYIYRVNPIPSRPQAALSALGPSEPPLLRHVDSSF